MKYEYYVVTNNNDSILLNKNLLTQVIPIQTNNIYLLSESTLSIILKHYLNISSINYLQKIQSEQYKKYVLNSYLFLDQIHFINLNRELIFKKFNDYQKIDLYKNNFLELNHIKTIIKDNKFKYLFLLYNDSIIIVDVDDLELFINGYIIKVNLYPDSTNLSYTYIKNINKIINMKHLTTFNSKILGFKINFTNINDKNNSFIFNEYVLARERKIDKYNFLEIINDSELKLKSLESYNKWKQIKLSKI